MRFLSSRASIEVKVAAVRGEDGAELACGEGAGLEEALNVEVAVADPAFVA